jgi:hypothetical protein
MTSNFLGVLFSTLINLDLAHSLTEILTMEKDKAQTVFSLIHLSKVYNYPRADFVFSILTYIGFFFCRVINFTYLNYAVYQEGLCKYYFITAPLGVMQYYWFYLMSKKLVKMLR